MNLDSIHRLIEETQTFQMHQPSVKLCCDVAAPATRPRDTCNPCLPPYGLQGGGAHNSSAHLFHNKWDVCEELRMRELEEVKARAAQMEKTMRWWSDCTANWREKWSKVRAERNSAREEGRQLRIKLEMTVEELSALKKKQSLSFQTEVRGAKVTRDPELPGFADRPCNHQDQFQISSQVGGSKTECPTKRQSPAEEAINRKEEGVVIAPLKLHEEIKHSPDCTHLFNNDGTGNCSVRPGLRRSTRSPPQENKSAEEPAMQVHWEEFQKILWQERQMRASLEKEIERLESALSVWKWKYEELKESRRANGKEFDILHDQHEDGIERISGDIKEESQNSKDRIICELRAELERLQAENTLEWDKKEFLETEKQGLERENRRLKVQMKEMEELLARKNRLSTNTSGPDFKTSQNELQEKNKPLER